MTYLERMEILRANVAALRERLKEPAGIWLSAEYLVEVALPAFDILEYISLHHTEAETKGGRADLDNARDLEDFILRAREIVGSPDYPELDE